MDPGFKRGGRGLGLEKGARGELTARPTAGARSFHIFVDEKGKGVRPPRPLGPRLMI